MDLLQKIMVAVVIVIVLSIVAQLFIFLLPFLILFIAFIIVRSWWIGQKIKKAIEENEQSSPFENDYNNSREYNSTNSNVIDVEYTERKINNDE